MLGIKKHASAEVSKKAIIGQGTIIWQNCVIQDDVVIGSNCSIGLNVFIENGVKIGKGVKIKNNVSIYSGVICEDDVFLGPNCVFTNVINPRSYINRKKELKNTYIKKGATIGANATIVCGNVIGNFSMVGAGTVVTKDILDYELVVGNPARVIGYVCQCGCKLKKNNGNKFICMNCNKKYVLNDRMSEDRSNVST